MRLMLILFGASVFVYIVTGFKGRFKRRARLYFAIGTFVVVYLMAMFLVFLEGGL